MSDDDPRIHPGCPHRRIVGGIPCPDILLCEEDGEIEPHAKAALAAAFASIIGVTVRRIDLVSDNGGKHRLSAEIDGWSPSLHGLAVQYTRDVRAVRGEVSVDGVRQAFADAVAEQKARSMAGVHMGLYAPLPVDDPDGARARPLEMRHVLVDTSLPALIAAEGEDPVRTLTDALRAVHTQPEDSEGGQFLANGMGLVIECGLGRLLGTTASIDVPGHPSNYDGLALRVWRAQIPDTVLAHAAGRPLRDVISIHPALDDRIVRSAEMDAHGAQPLSITLEPHLIPFDQVAAAAARWER